MFVIVAALILSAGPSQSPITSITRGGALKTSAYQTGTAAMTFYVDPTGSDTSACVATGTGACATLPGAFAKLPRFVTSVVSINVAAGTYTGVMTPIDLTLEGTGSVIVSGPALTNVSPASGTASGTLTANSNAIPATFTDSGQTWTVDDLVGAFLTITNGAAAGTSLPIISNTATTVVTAYTFGTGPGNATYAIQKPAAKFTQSTAGAAITMSMRAQSLIKSTVIPTSALGTAGLAAANVSFFNLDFEATGSTGNAVEVSSGNAIILFQNCRMIGTAASSTGLALRIGNVAVINSTAQALGNGILVGNNSGSNTTGVPSLYVERTLAYGSTAGTTTNSIRVFTGETSGFGGLRTGCTSSQVCGGLVYMSASPATAGNASSFTGYVKCNSTGAGVLLLAPYFARVSTMYIDGCQVGLNGQAMNASIKQVVSLVCNNVTTACITATLGSKVQITSASITGSAPTQEILVDTTAHTIAQVTGALPSTVITNSATGSTVYQ